MKKRKTLPSILVAAPLILFGGLITSGCPDDDAEETLEEVGEDVDEAADDVKDAVDDK